MTYCETIEYLFNRMPMFERQGASGYKEGLSNTIALDEHFNHPHRNYKTIHVGGTNGKGSCSHTLASILQGYGFKVGLYTSPHLIDFRERIRVNGVSISEEYVTDFVEKERAFFEPLYPSFFEVTTALAFKYFADMEVDIAVIEVGLGGRLDCTNIINPVLSVITNISLDHTQFLGNTMKAIAAEKAGIVKPYTPVVIGEYTPETRGVFEETVQHLSSPITFAEDAEEIVNISATDDGGALYSTKSYGCLHGELGGLYQKKNAATVLAAYNSLIKSGVIDYDLQRLKEGFKNVCSRTGLMGRWQRISQKPLIICDTGHNVAGWEYLSEQIKRIKCDQKHIIFGMVDDKDADGVLSLLPQDATYYFVSPDTKRAIPAEKLMASAIDHHLHGNVYDSVNDAYATARAVASDTDFIFIGGSNYLVGDFLKACQQGS